ncbi:hypothetical protein H2198_002437 [Neophaeococcomyces mojaviensis]|uniref:Uncharacterized protein n=1 Tax=Neophaeococcomyces mojaviensis TaxID=3383035 RepID=A0ACC3AEI7_9EURO|nr:hypothetical protein H2198_002437 [Knufia sp. JES_112]
MKKSTTLAEERQNPAASFGRTTGAERDIGRNKVEETSNLGGGLSERLDQVDNSNPKDFGTAKSGDYNLVVGAEGDAHEKAAGKQP